MAIKSFELISIDAKRYTKLGERIRTSESITTLQ